MKLVREHIYEEFKEYSDPIKDMEIGIFAKHNFESIEEFIEFMFIAIPAILKTTKIPKDILFLHYTSDYDRRTIHEKKYFERIDRYLEKYISYKNISLKYNTCEIYNWNDVLSKFLREKGY